VKAVVKVLMKKLEAKGVHIQSTSIPKFNEHPHQWQLNTLLFLIGSIGFLAFVMGAVLVSQLMAAIMAAQVRQIGIMKAIGGSQWQIFSMYIGMLLMIGLLAGIPAILLAINTGKAFATFVAAKLNFDILTTSLPISTYLLLLIVSLLLPVLLSFSTILKGTLMSVKSALSDYGISQNRVVSQKTMFKKSVLPDTVLLGIRNLQRNPKRLVITVLAMAFGVAIFSTGFNVRQSLWQLLEKQRNEMKYDVQVVLKKSVAPQKCEALFSQTDNIQQIETWVGGKGEIQSKLISTDEGAGVVALPYATNMVNMNIVAGRWLKKGSEIEIVMNQQAWSLYNNPAVDSLLNLRLGEKTIQTRLTGIVEQFERPKIYIDLTEYNTIANPEQLVNTIVFLAKDNDYRKVIALKKSIEKSLESSDLKILYVMSRAERVKIIYDHLDIILTIILILSFMVLLVSAIGMTSAMGISISERTREIGVMRAIGATPGKVYSLFLTEGFISNSISVILGLLLSFPLSQLTAIFFGKLMLGEQAILQYAFSFQGFVITIITTLFFGWLASRIPARQAIAISTHQALSYE
jgi:putative ABC transport system permease protein